MEKENLELDENKNIESLMRTHPDQASIKATLNLVTAVVGLRVAFLDSTKSSNKLSRVILGATVAGVVVPVVLFWWNTHQSSYIKGIKSTCYAQAEFDTRAISQSDDKLRREFINDNYDDCLMRFGIK